MANIHIRKTEWIAIASVLSVALMMSAVAPNMGFSAIAAATAENEEKTFDNNEQYSAEFLIQALDDLTPYMKVNDDKTLSFDKDGARDAGLSSAVVKVGREMAELNNDMIKIIGEHEKMNSDRINQTKVHKFEKFFEAVQQGKTGPTKSVAARNGDMFGLIQYASADPGDVCGGQQSNPHPAPAWVESLTYRSTQAQIVTIVTGMGFHQTAWYASYNTNDYTKNTSGYGCASPIFRDQIIIWNKVGSGYTWRQQGHIGATNFGEPNPEILGYVWPVYWWGTYVQWWHNNF